MKNTLLAQARSIRKIVGDYAAKGCNTHYEIGQSLNLLRDSALGYTPEPHRDKLATLMPHIQVRKPEKGCGEYTINTVTALVLCDQILSILEFGNSASTDDPDEDQSTALQRLVPRSKKVFLVHGHDMTNTLRLRTTLKERFELTPVILSEQPSRSQSVIEKFELEASQTAFAFVLITADDFVVKGNANYPQARPNVLFELGWFFGRLGRNRVCILFQEGTSVPSDLDGIVRIQFRSSVTEKLDEIENELVAAGLLAK